MDNYNELSEILLDGWLKMSMSIWNRRLVTQMTYNESMVCNLLTRQLKENPKLLLTPTDLCSRLQIRKSQMNVILNKMETEGLIQRKRSETDKRNVYIRLTEKGQLLYQEVHKEILTIPNEVIERLGEEKIQGFARIMQEVAECFDLMMREKRTDIK